MKGLLVLVLVVFTTACSNNATTPSGPPPVPPPPTYAGTWTGSYAITSCTQNGQVALADICGGSPPGKVLPVTFKFSQSDRSVSGEFLMGAVSFLVSNATILSDGSLTITATYNETSVTITSTWTLHNTAQVLTGSMSSVWTSSGLTGQIAMAGTIRSMTRTSTTAASTRLRPRAGTLRGTLDAMTEH